MKIIDIFRANKIKTIDIYTTKDIVVKGWIISNRGNEKIRFIELNDGSTFDNIQVVVTKNISEISDGRMGAAVEVKGKIKLTPDRPQPFELVAEDISILKNTDLDYPIQKKEMTREMLRDIPHLRHRTQLFRAVMRIRSTLAQEIHNFFSKKDFLLCSSPIFTSNDGEGAGEVFLITDSQGKKDFFNRQAFLTVTGQLHAESYALGFGNVYTFGPTFRAENSNTQRHAAEFWMLEPEMAFYDLNMNINLADEMLKQVIGNTIKKHPSEFKFLDENIEKGLLDKLNNFLNNDLQRVEYRDAIEILKKVVEKDPKKFEFTDIKFGVDLASEHERYLSEEHFKAPIAVINYPKEIKAFYMYQNPDNETVAAFDLLVPGIGELIGGSQRETNYDKLLKRINELKINQEDLQWYLDLRRFGDSMSSGFGLGFERLIMFVTGVQNIRDTIPFPRTPGTIRM